MPNKFRWNIFAACMAKFLEGLAFVEDNWAKFPPFAQLFAAETLYDPIALFVHCVRYLWSTPAAEAKRKRMLMIAGGSFGLPASGEDSVFQERVASCMQW